MGEQLTDRITTDLDVLVGKPIIRGTRISVEFLLDLLANGWSRADILRGYPFLVDDDISACIAYAKELVSEQKAYPSAA